MPLPIYALVYNIGMRNNMKVIKKLMFSKM